MEKPNVIIRTSGDASETLRTVAGRLHDITLTFELELIEELKARNAALEAEIRNLLDIADSGEWHSSIDCEVEGRTDCMLCEALKHAAQVILP